MPHPDHERNRRSWNAVTSAHNSHKGDQAAFLAGGGSTLFPEELELLGDVRGTRLLHLQCNCGQDSLSLAARGAEVTGVDIADAPIAFARRLSEESGIAATFERSDLFDWFAEGAAGRRFDRVLSSYGTIGWLSDLGRWARGVRSVLAPGGRLVLLEFHPMCWCVDAEGRWIDAYLNDEPIREAEGVSDYVARSGDGLLPMGRTEGVQGFTNPEPAVSYQYAIGEIVQAMLDAGLILEQLREYPYANGAKIHDGMREAPGRRYVMPDAVPGMPLMLGVVASAPKEG
ncbi:MAG: class I SAM-dependent methyltransferase [Myxococcota bacterium]